MARELLKDRTRDFVAAFCWLIRISSRPNSDFLARLDLAQFVPQQVRGVLLDVDLALEIHAVAHFHELMRIARVAVLAGELAAAIGVDRPGKRHARRSTAAQPRAGWQSEIFNVVAFRGRFACRGEPRNPN